MAMFLQVRSVGEAAEAEQSKVWGQLLEFLG